MLRVESMTGGEMWLMPDGVKLPGITWARGAFYLSNFTPFEMIGHTWGVTHHQKLSHKGWLRANPTCYHQWKWSELQKKDANGGWIMGTERGLYFRKPTIKIFGFVITESWRWDVPGTKDEQGILRHWIPTKGFLGGHWD